MKAAVLRVSGQPPRYEDFPDPVAGDSEVIVEVRAAALKPVDKQIASGTHYASPRSLPAVCGTDGVGHLPDGARVFFGGARAPYGAMAQRSVVRQAFCFPIPPQVDDITAAALPNPGVSAWLTLAHRAKLVKGEGVLILGATGVTGRLAVKIAKILGAGRVVAAGRDPEALRSLLDGGADEVVSLDAPGPQLAASFMKAAADRGFQVVIDYVWGAPAEAFLAAAAQKEFAAITAETRFVQVGESAGPTITLPAAVLRSTALTIMGTAGIPPVPVLQDAMKQVMAHAATGELRVETESIPLSGVEQAWNVETKGRRLVLLP
jgi:NADPH2:quinone reductase